MKYDNIILFAIQGKSGREEVEKGVAALKRKNTGKSRRVCVVHCETTQKIDLVDVDKSTSNTVVTKTEPGEVAYDEPIGVYVVSHIHSFPENLPDLLQQHLRSQALGGEFRIGYLCLVVCSLAESTKHLPLPKMIGADGGEQHLMAKLIRELLRRRLAPGRVSAYAKSVFIHYDAVGVPTGKEEGLSYEGRKYTAFVRGGQPGHFHDFPGARSKHKIQWTFQPSSGAYRMGGTVEDVVPSVELLTTTIESHAVVSPRPTHAAVGLRPVWVPDSVRPDCSACGKAFHAFRRRHHCRQCGEIFCADCSGQEKHVFRPVPEPGQPPHAVNPGPVRVCDACFRTI